MTHHFIRMVPIGLLLMAMIGGCKNQTPSQAADDDAVLTKDQHLDAPAQVVYRIDDHRFVSLEDYNRCYGDVFYNDTQKHLHTHLFVDDPRNYQGRLMIDDLAGMNIVIPTAANGPCSDHTCRVPATYSTDGGHTFAWLDYIDESTSPSRDSGSYTAAVTSDAVYFEEKLQYSTRVTKYPLVPGFVYGGDQSLPGDLKIESVPEMPAGLRTPSGQDHFTCDESIRPSNFPQKKP